MSCRKEKSCDPGVNIESERIVGFLLLNVIAEAAKRRSQANSALQPFIHSDNEQPVLAQEPKMLVAEEGLTALAAPERLAVDCQNIESLTPGVVTGFSLDPPSALDHRKVLKPGRGFTSKVMTASAANPSRPASGKKGLGEKQKKKSLGVHTLTYEEHVRPAGLGRGLVSPQHLLPRLISQTIRHRLLELVVGVCSTLGNVGLSVYLDEKVKPCRVA